jgi:hypothetical protein
MFRGHLVWGKMFTGHLVGGRLVKASFETAVYREIVQMKQDRIIPIQMPSYQDDRISVLRTLVFSQGDMVHPVQRA